jgi:hypothetical protein
MKQRAILIGVLSLVALLPALAVGLTKAQGPEPQSEQSIEDGLGTAFTYQGRLTEGGSFAGGGYDFRFRLYDSVNGGELVSTYLADGITIVDGLFTTKVDFDTGVFEGDARWLEVAVRPAGISGNYTVLGPRQAITPAPYAMYSQNAAAHDHWGEVWTGTSATGLTLLGGGTGISSLGSAHGVFGQALGTVGHGVYGEALSSSGANYGVYGLSMSTAGTGVRGQAPASSGSTRGVFGRTDSTAGTGVGGLAASSTGTSYGVHGRSLSPDGYGVYGINEARSGNARGVYGITYSPEGSGVYGTAPATEGEGYGVYGVSASTDGQGVAGWASATEGSTYGVRGQADSSDGTGVAGYAQSTTGYATGVDGQSRSSDGTGVHGLAYSSSGNARGVWGESRSQSGYGVLGEAISKTGVNAGVEGTSASPDGYGVYGYASSTTGTNYAVAGYTRSSAGYAGYFSGNLHVTGAFTCSGGKAFKIDHPLDPANQYLYHYSLESSEVLNQYSGNVTLDAQGDGWVQLPDWFQLMNTDFRYQLTPIGAPAPSLHVAQEVEGNRFGISGGEPGMKVSWSVTALRADPYMQQNPHPLVQEKPESERGTYLSPESYGQPGALGLDYQRAQEIAVQSTPPEHD